MMHVKHALSAFHYAGPEDSIDLVGFCPQDIQRREKIYNNLNSGILGLGDFSDISCPQSIPVSLPSAS